MGSKLSTPGSDPTAQCPGTEDIHTAYRQGDPSRARHLLREACDESTSQLEKVRPEPTRPARTGPLGGRTLVAHVSRLFAVVVMGTGIPVMFRKGPVSH